MGALQFARSRYCAEWGGAVPLRVDSDYRHKQESFKPNEMCGSPRSRDTGLFCLIMSFQQRDFGRVASTGALQQGATAGVHQQGASAGMLKQGCFGRGAHRQGNIDRRLRQGRTSAGAHRQEASQGCFGRVTSAGALRQGHSERGHSERGASTFSKYYEFPVTINGNIRLYCGTTRKRRQEKDYKRMQ